MPKLKPEKNTKKLNARSVESEKARPGRDRDVIWDKGKGAPKGFGVRISGETKTYVVTYRLNGRFTWYTIGSVTSGGKLKKVSLSAARKKAGDVIATVQLGGDPMQEKVDKREADEAKRNAADFEALCGWFVDAREPNLATSTATEYRRMITAYVKGSPLARIGAAEVAAADLERRLQAVAKDNGPVMANRLFQFFRAVCRWGRRKGKLPTNPMDAVDRPRKEKPRERRLSDEEIRFLWTALDGDPPRFPPQGPAVAACPPQPAPVAAAVKLQLLLGQRPGETLSMLWTDVDLDKREWLVRDRKNGQPNVVPLPRQAEKILEALKPITGSKERVFDGVSEANEERDWWGAIRDRVLSIAAEAKVEVEPFTRHDLRRTCATRLGDLGIADEVIALVLGHKKRDITGRVYNLSARMDERRKALAKWGAFVERVVSEQKKGADVLSMGRA